MLGYMTGLVIERALATTERLDQMDIHDAVFALSGKLKTLDGPFELTSEARRSARSPRSASCSRTARAA